MEQNTSKGGGIGFFGLLTIVFITLKLTDVIQWSWFWVLSPLLASVLFFVIMAIIIFVAVYVSESKE